MSRRSRYENRRPGITAMMPGHLVAKFANARNLHSKSNRSESADSNQCGGKLNAGEADTRTNGVTLHAARSAKQSARLPEPDGLHLHSRLSLLRSQGNTVFNPVIRHFVTAEFVIDFRGLS